MTIRRPNEFRRSHYGTGIWTRCRCGTVFEAVSARRRWCDACEGARGRTYWGMRWHTLACLLVGAIDPKRPDRAWRAALSRALATTAGPDSLSAYRAWPAVPHTAVDLGLSFRYASR